MIASVYEVKTNFSRFLEIAESGGEVIVSRHKKAVARIVPIAPPRKSRFGTIAGRKFRMGPGFDDPSLASALADDFGIPKK
jgi:prevent-host-death family protein